MVYNIQKLIQIKYIGSAIKKAERDQIAMLGADFIF